MAATNDAKIWAVIGASGTGKGLWFKQQLQRMKPARLIAWDFMNEYGDHAREARSLEAIRRAMVKAGEAGPLRLRYVPKGSGEKALRKEFETLCELVYAWGACVFIAEELANVTTPGWAPAAWRKMTTSGRHAAVHIVGFTQTPALVDKTFLGNANFVHVCALREDPHRIYTARKIDRPLREVTELAKFEYLERDFDAGTFVHGWCEGSTPELKKAIQEAKNNKERERAAAGKPSGASPTGRGAVKAGRKGKGGE